MTPVPEDSLARLRSVCVQHRSTIRDAVSSMDRNSLGIVLVVDDRRRLVATVTDGDVRRAILGGVDLDASISELIDRRTPLLRKPVTAPASAGRDVLLDLMQRSKVRHIPIVAEDSSVVNLVTMADLLPEEALNVRAVVMAGGLGKRLRPLTEEMPKPMLPVGDRPLLELTLAQLRQCGIRHVSITTHYMAEKIAAHFGDGREFGVDLTYHPEDRQLGTAGGLGHIDAGSDEPLLVMNGDILTSVDFRAMIEYHHEHAADLTVAVAEHEFRIPYGVVETRGPAIVRLSEKPVIRNFINAGIYLLGPNARRQIPAGQRSDMTDLIDRCLRHDYNVVSFPIREYWMDIGHLDDYNRAVSDKNAGLVRKES